MAGLGCMGIVSEPTAAAITCALKEKRENQDKELLSGVSMFCDLGGGTFDVSIMRHYQSDVGDSRISIMAIDGDAALGGQDVTTVMMDVALERFKTNGVKDEYWTKKRKSRLWKELDAKKKSLTQARTIRVETNDEDETEIVITREMIEENLDDIKERLKVAMKSAENEARGKSIDSILFVGGSSRLWWFEEFVKSIYPGTPISRPGDPDHLVAQGAAWYSVVKGGFMTFLTISRVLPKALGVICEHSWFGKIITKMTQLPCGEQDTFLPPKSNPRRCTLSIYEGNGNYKYEDDMYKLGELKLIDLKRETMVVVQFKVDEDGIVEVTAFDKKNPDNKNSITLCTQSGEGQSKILKHIIRGKE